MEDAPKSPNIAAQMDHIREQVQRFGNACVGCAELQLLCDGEVDQSRQAILVAKIARWENWNYRVLADGTVRFEKQA